MMPDQVAKADRGGDDKVAKSGAAAKAESDCSLEGGTSERVVVQELDAADVDERAVLPHPLLASENPAPDDDQSPITKSQAELVDNSNRERCGRRERKPAEADFSNGDRGDNLRVEATLNFDALRTSAFDGAHREVRRPTAAR
jgi:hypothetical protein